MPAFAALDARVAADHNHYSVLVRALGVIIAVLTAAVCTLVVTWLMVADARDTTRDNNRRIVEMRCDLYEVHRQRPPPDLDC